MKKQNTLLLCVSCFVLISLFISCEDPKDWGPLWDGAWVTEELTSEDGLLLVYRNDSTYSGMTLIPWEDSNVYTNREAGVDAYGVNIDMSDDTISYVWTIGENQEVSRTITGTINSAGTEVNLSDNDGKQWTLKKREENHPFIGTWKNSGNKDPFTTEYSSYHLEDFYMTIDEYSIKITAKETGTTIDAENNTVPYSNPYSMTYHYGIDSSDDTIMYVITYETAILPAEVKTIELSDDGTSFTVDGIVNTKQ